MEKCDDYCCIILKTFFFFFFFGSYHDYFSFADVLCHCMYLLSSPFGTFGALHCDCDLFLCNLKSVRRVRVSKICFIPFGKMCLSNICQIKIHKGNGVIY